MESRAVTNTVTASYDKTGDWFIVDEPNHHWVHEGYLFEATVKNNTLAASSYINFEFITPSTVRWVHLKEVYSQKSGVGFLELFESVASTHTASAVAVIPVNHNRNSTIVSLVTVRANVTTLPRSSAAGSSSYNILASHVYGSSGTNAARTGGVYEPRNEFYLKPNTTYIVQLWNETAGGYAELSVVWYEAPLKPEVLL